MPYKTISELPDSVKNNLPSHAREIYKEAFNNAEEQYKDPNKRRGEETLEETAHKVAWAAVKTEYKKNDSGEWVKK